MKTQIKFSIVTLILLLTYGEAGDVFAGTANVASGNDAAVVGGFANHARGVYSFVGGGNHNDAVSHNSSILGGSNNKSSATNSTIGGGSKNQTMGDASTITGGRKNQATGLESVVSGGSNNHASGKRSLVIGGHQNSALGKYSAVIHGYTSFATQEDSLAIGDRVISQHRGAVVIGDSNYKGHLNTSRMTGEVDRFYAFFDRGYTLFTSSHRGPNETGIYINHGESAWNTVSDKNKKENYEEVDKQKVLDKLIAMPMEKWNYKAQDDKVKHIGPYAQDFNKAYGLGDGKLSISTIDSDGIALTSIQALAERNKHLSEKNKALESKVNSLELRFSKLEKELL